MTCKDCLHYVVCSYYTHDPIGILCSEFVDKSEWVHLPCKVGTDIFYPVVYEDVGEYIHVGKVVSINVIVASFNDSNASYVFARYDDRLSCWHSLTDIGKKVFFTREEAEKALAERRKENGEVH